MSLIHHQEIPQRHGVSVRVSGRPLHVGIRLGVATVWFDAGGPPHGLYCAWTGKSFDRPTMDYVGTLNTPPLVCHYYTEPCRGRIVGSNFGDYLNNS